MDKLYTINEVAAKLNLSDKTLRRWEEAGRFHPTRTLGNQRRYSLEDLQILDAIKHNTIPDQDDLLTIEQAARFCGVSTITIGRWENSGKIHPFITAGNTYYPRHHLTEKLAQLKNETAEEVVPPFVPPSPVPTERTVLSPPPKLSPLKLDQKPSSKYPNIDLDSWKPYLINVILTCLILLVYHFLSTAAPAKPLSPQGNPGTGSVQGVATTSDPRLDALEQKFKDYLAEDMLAKAKPTPVTTINLSGSSLISGTDSLKKGKDQITVNNQKIMPTSIVTVGFVADYAPAKKYWLTLAPGSFTIHTDFPVGADTPFNYLILESAPTATAAAKTP